MRAATAGVVTTAQVVRGSPGSVDYGLWSALLQALPSSGTSSENQEGERANIGKLLRNSLSDFSLFSPP